MYALKGVDELNNEKNIKERTPHDFIRKTFLKIHVKGKYVYSYDIIAEKDIPEKIRDQLKIVTNKNKLIFIGLFFHSYLLQSKESSLFQHQR